MPGFPLTTAEDTTEDATVTAPTVLPTMATDTADGTMGMTMYTAANSVGIKAAAVWTKETCHVWTKKEGTRAYI